MMLKESNEFRESKEPPKEANEEREIKREIKERLHMANILERERMHKKRRCWKKS